MLLKVFQKTVSSLHSKQAISACALFFLNVCGPAGAQATPDDMTFEVASIRPVVRDASHRFDAKRYGAHFTASSASYHAMTLGNLVAYAYGLHFFQVIGPEWIAVDRYDIEAKFPDQEGKPDDLGMLRALLRDRFKLVGHTEKRSLDGYALVIGEHGERLKPSEPDLPTLDSEPFVSKGESGAGGRPEQTPANSQSETRSGGQTGARGTQTVKFDQEKNAQHWELSKIRMADLVPRLGFCIDGTYHTVIDETGKQGNYQVAYDCANPRNRAEVGPESDMAPSDPQGSFVLTRSLDAMGLKLVKRKMPTEVYVVDHADKPSPN